MKFGLMFANGGPFGEPDLAVHLATTAESVGIESLWTVEHVVVPVGYESEYPYSRNGRMPGADDVPIPDPLIWLSYVAGATRQIRLATGILILPQRHPAYVAKEVATLDRLSQGRVTLGVGIGWLREEFETLGIPFAERAGRTEEAIAALRSLWKPGAEAFKGRYYAWDAVESNPKPVQSGGVPIVVGGHVENAARRAARCGDGFFPGRGDEATLGRLLEALRDECDRLGRDPAEIEITFGLRALDADAIRRVEDLGVSRLIVTPPAFDRDGVSAGLEKLGDEVISRH